MKNLFALTVMALIAIVVFFCNGCTYQIVQQQQGSRRGVQAVTVGNEEHRVTAYQSSGYRQPAVQATVVVQPQADPPPSFYPEYNGYPGSGYRQNGYVPAEGLPGYYGEGVHAPWENVPAYLFRRVK
jgi:hypothetical protein